MTDKEKAIPGKLSWNGNEIINPANAMWGVAGISSDQPDTLGLEICYRYNNHDALVEALEKISKAEPDQLDHSIDVAIIQRAVKIAKAALKAAKDGK